MKTLKCADLGSMDCNFVATGETAEEAKNKMYAHAKEIHADKLKEMTSEQQQEMDKKMDELLA